MTTVTVKVTDGAGGTATKSVSYTVSSPGSSLSPFHMVGISSSREGLDAGESHKKQACLDRYSEMAQQLGVTPAAMRKLGGRHVYDQSTAPVANVMNIGVFANCVNDGYGCVMLTSSRWSNITGAGDGAYDATIKSCLQSMSAQNIRVIWNVKHEPSNNGMTTAEQASWRKLQARMAAMVFDHNDPDIYYTDCHIPMAADEAAWNWMPELKALRPNDWQEISARTYLGMDPYPEVGMSGSTHVLQTIAQKVNKGVAAQRAAGRTGPLMLNEVGLFNWCIPHSETYTLTQAQQAQRLHDELWTWGQKNNLMAYFYYDVADLRDSDVRDSSRMLDSPEELKEYAKLVRGDYYQ